VVSSSHACALIRRLGFFDSAYVDTIRSHGAISAPDSHNLSSTLLCLPKTSNSLHQNNLALDRGGIGSRTECPPRPRKGPGCCCSDSRLPCSVRSSSPALFCSSRMLPCATSLPCSIEPPSVHVSGIRSDPLGLTSRWVATHRRPAASNFLSKAESLPSPSSAACTTDTDARPDRR